MSLAFLQNHMWFVQDRWSQLSQQSQQSQLSRALLTCLIFPVEILLDQYAMEVLQTWNYVFLAYLYWYFML